MQLELPTEPVTLTVEQLQELNGKLSRMRHDINNALTVIIGTTEIIKHKPEAAQRLLEGLAQQPGRITDSMKTFCTDFEQVMGIKRR